ncbi:hypothetical protein GmHk_02G005168 [Glycine max]|nr:hypothetical protein GmHk_02G005168 [Glycine max]
MTFSAAFAYLEGERLNKFVWALQRFRGLFLKVDVLPGIIVTNRDLALMNAVKTVFSEATNLLCQFHIDKNVKAKCKTLVGQKNAWEYVMEAYGSLVDCPCKNPSRYGCVIGTTHGLPCDSIENITDVKVDGKCGYRAIVALLGMDEDSWSLVRNHLHKELTRWSEEYINLLGDIERFEELKHSLLVDGLSMVTIDKWMNITDMGYAIASRYNVIVVSLSRLQSMTFFLLRSQPPPNSFVHRVICIGHVFFLRDHCLLPPLTLLWNTHCHYQTKQWPTPYIGRMHRYTNLSRLKTEFVDLGEE